MEDQSGTALRVPPSLRYTRFGLSLLPTARSRSPSPSTSPHARLVVQSLKPLASQTVLGVSTPPSLRYRRLVRPEPAALLLPVARSRSPSPSTSPQATLVVLSLSVEDQTALGVNTPPSLRYSRLGCPLLPIARSRSPSPSTSPQATLVVLLLSVEAQTALGFSTPPSLRYTRFR